MNRLLTTGVCFLLTAQRTQSQFGQPTNANPFVDQMLKDVIEAANESMFIEDEQYVLVVDLFILRPELQLQVTTDI